MKFTKYQKEIANTAAGGPDIVLLDDIPADGYLYKTFLFERSGDTYTRQFKVWGRLSDDLSDTWTEIASTDVIHPAVCGFYINNDYYSFIRVTVVSLISDGLVSSVVMAMRE